jgi:predicted transcriptional regulator
MEEEEQNLDDATGGIERPRVKCMICGKELKYVNPFHLKTHGITLEEYRNRYPDVDVGTPRVKSENRASARTLYNGPMVKCEVCGKAMQFISFFHLRTHGMTIQGYKDKYPNSSVGSPQRESKYLKKKDSLKIPGKIDEHDCENHLDVKTDISDTRCDGKQFPDDEETDERVTCQVCGEKFFVLNVTHLKKHDMTVEEYQMQYPDADMGSTRSSSMKYKRLVAYDNPIEKETKEFVSLNIVEKGKLNILRPEKSAYVRFRELRTRLDWTVSKTIHTLIDFFEKHENDEGIGIAIDQMKHASSGLPKDFIPQHRAQLQNLLSILEEKAFAEKDPVKLASLTDKIIKINLALPQLEKTDESLVDLKIKEIVEKRKLVFANSLPEFN